MTVDLTVRAPRWTEAVESLTRQIEGLRSTALAEYYTGFANSLLRQRVQDLAVDKDAPDEAVVLTTEQAVALAQSAMGAVDPAMAENDAMREVRALLNFTSDMYSNLQQASPVYITDEMMRLADVAASAMPANMDITAQMLLEPRMWLYFEQGIPLRDVHGATVVIKAACIGSDAHLDESTPGFDMIYYSDASDPRDTTVIATAAAEISSLSTSLLPLHVTGVRFGSRPRYWTDNEIANISDEGWAWACGVTLGDEHDIEAVKAAGIDSRRLERFIVAVLLLLQQKEVQVVDGYSRAAHRRWERARRTEVGGKTVELKSRVVVLRQKVYEESEKSGKPTNYSHRWWRRGHWRQYREGKWTYVAGHVCGPEDKAFIPRYNAYTWER